MYLSILETKQPTGEKCGLLADTGLKGKGENGVKSGNSIPNPGRMEIPLSFSVLLFSKCKLELVLYFNDKAWRGSLRQERTGPV